jgi:hypothetical protein
VPGPAALTGHLVIPWWQAHLVVDVPAVPSWRGRVLGWRARGGAEALSISGEGEHWAVGGREELV